MVGKSNAFVNWPMPGRFKQCTCVMCKITQFRWSAIMW